MLKISSYCVLPIAVFASPAIAQMTATDSTRVTIQQGQITDLQARFARLQQLVRPDDLAFELQLVNADQSLLQQRRDGIIRLPQDWVAAAPDRETLDFLMLLALSDAVTHAPPPAGPSETTKVVTSVIGLIAVNAAKNQERSASRDPGLHLPRARFASIPSPGQSGTALRALGWAVASGSCEAKIVFGLRRLGAVPGAMGVASRQIVKDLGPVAWTPNDRCGPAAN